MPCQEVALLCLSGQEVAHFLPCQDVALSLPCQEVFASLPCQGDMAAPQNSSCCPVPGAQPAAATLHLFPGQTVWPLTCLLSVCGEALAASLGGQGVLATGAWPALAPGRTLQAWARLELSGWAASHHCHLSLADSWTLAMTPPAWAPLLLWPPASC